MREFFLAYHLIYFIIQFIFTVQFLYKIKLLNVYEAEAKHKRIFLTLLREQELKRESAR